MGSSRVLIVTLVACCLIGCSSGRHEPHAKSDPMDAATSADAKVNDAAEAVDASAVAWPDDGSSAEGDCAAPANARLDVLSQSELEALRGCRRFRGDLIVAGKDITDLSPLESLTVVSGRLAIGTHFRHWRESAQLLPIENLAALAKLQSAGTLELSTLAVRDFSDLHALTKVRELVLERLEGPRDLVGLEAVHWSEKLTITECNNLHSLEGLTVGATVDTLSLSSNPQLNDISALRSLRTARLLHLKEMPMPDLSGLAGLEQITEVLNFTSCGNLLDLEGLGAISTQGSIILMTNPQLSSTTGLRISGEPTIELYENPQLADLVLGVEDGFKRVRSLRSIRQPTVSSLRGLRDIDIIDELSISGARGLESLAGLEGLTHADSITLDSNTALVSFEGLSHLKTKLASLNVYGNSRLTSLRSLASVPGAAAADIHSNVMLPECEVRWLSDRWHIEVTSFDNDLVAACPAD